MSSNLDRFVEEIVDIIDKPCKHDIRLLAYSNLLYEISNETVPDVYDCLINTLSHFQIDNYKKQIFTLSRIFTVSLLPSIIIDIITHCGGNATTEDVLFELGVLENLSRRVSDCAKLGKRNVFGF